MPGTASSQIQSRSSVKARPSANVRAGNLVANTPVLFRLPAIPNTRTQDLAATLSETAAILPPAALAAVVSTSTQPASNPNEEASAVSEAPQTASQQSWWEHWSSGIVLIVLLIALATASILAWQGSNKSNSKLMADTNKGNDSSGDLSAIEVPKLVPKQDVPRVEAPVSAGSNASNDTALQPEIGSDLESSLIPSEPLSLTIDSQRNNEPAESKPVSYATASLQTPVVKQQEPLFKDDGLLPTKPNISAQPASVPTQRTTPNSVTSPSAGSPSVWDSSSNSSPETNKPLTLELGGLDSNPETASSATDAKPTGDTTNRMSVMLVSQRVTDTSKAGTATSITVPVPKNMQYAGKTSTPEFDSAPLFAAYRQFAMAEEPSSATNDNRYKATENTGSSALAETASGNAATSVGNTQELPTRQPTPQWTIPPQSSQPAQASNNYTLQPAHNYATNAPSQQYQQHSPQYGPQTQPNPLNSLQTPSLQERGVQVPYNTQPAVSNPSALQLPPGPIGGYGVQQTSPTGTTTGTQSGISGGTSSSGASNSLNYPSIQ